MDENLEIKSVIISYDDSEPITEVDVVIGDGKTDFGADYPFDHRIYFYFHNFAEYNSAKDTTIDPNIGFRIIGEVN